MKNWRVGLFVLLMIASQEIPSGQRLGFAASNNLVCSNGVYKYYSIWGPHGSDEIHWRTVKWKKPIRIAIIDDTHGSSSAQEFKAKLYNIAKAFQIASNVDITILPESGTQTGDVVLVISNNVGPSNDKNSDVLTSMFRGANYSNSEAMARSSSLRFAWGTSNILCDGVLAGNTTEGVVGAYLFAESYEGRSCVVRIFAAMFGIETPPPSDEGSIRDDDREVRVLGALKELYGPEIVQGMDDTQVRETMVQNCK